MIISNYILEIDTPHKNPCPSGEEVYRFNPISGRYECPGHMDLEMPDGPRVLGSWVSRRFLAHLNLPSEQRDTYRILEDFDLQELLRPNGLWGYKLTPFSREDKLPGNIGVVDLNLECEFSYALVGGHNTTTGLKVYFLLRLPDVMIGKADLLRMPRYSAAFLVYWTFGIFPESGEIVSTVTSRMDEFLVSPSTSYHAHQYMLLNDFASIIREVISGDCHTDFICYSRGVPTLWQNIAYRTLLTTKHLSEKLKESRVVRTIRRVTSYSPLLTKLVLSGLTLIGALHASIFAITRLPFELSVFVYTVTFSIGAYAAFSFVRLTRVHDFADAVVSWFTRMFL